VHAVGLGAEYQKRCRIHSCRRHSRSWDFTRAGDDTLDHWRATNTIGVAFDHDLDLASGDNVSVEKTVSLNFGKNPIKSGVTSLLIPHSAVENNL